MTDRSTYETAAGRSSVVDSFICFLGGALVTIIPWSFDKRFYFRDDIQAFSLPLLYHIGRSLRDGVIPFVSLANYTTSNLFGEYQLGLLNPFSLVINLILPSIDDRALAGTLMAMFYAGVLSSGVFLLARSYGISRPNSFLCALVIATNNYLVYWFAGTWSVILISIAWMVWAWAFLLTSGKSSAHWLLCVFFCYLTITVGWPQTTLFLGALACCVAYQQWQAGDRASCIQTLLAITAAGLLASFALLALVSVDAITGRVKQFVNFGFLVPDLRDMLTVSSPFHRGYISIYGGYRLISSPIYYVAWFVAPMAAFVQWRNIRTAYPPLISLLVISCATLVLTQGPEQLYSLRYSFRWIAYFHIAFILFAFVVWTRAGSAPVTQRRVFASVALIILQSISSLQAYPQDWRLHLFGAAVMLTCLAAVGFVTKRESIVAATFALSSLGFFVVTHWIFPINSIVADWGSRTKSNVNGLRAGIPSGYAFYLGGLPNGTADSFDELQIGNTSIEAERPQINGYSAVIPAALTTYFCMGIWGTNCPGAGPNLFKKDALTGVTIADLLKVNTIIAEKGAHLSAVLPFLDSSWRLEKEGSFSVQYKRPLALPNYPGSVSWVSAQAKVISLVRASPMRESIDIDSSGPDPIKVVYARLPWPGYGARFNNATVTVEPYLNFFTSINLPAGARGKLELYYRPPFWLLGIGATAAGFILTMLMGIFHSSSRNYLARVWARPSLRREANA